MTRKLILTLAAGFGALSLAACGDTATAPAVDNSGSGDPIVNYEAQDAAMNGAIAEARATLPIYLARLDAGRITPEDSLKVGFPTENGGSEHIWVNHIERKGDGLTGRLANEPNFMPGLTLGSPVDFKTDLVSDWSYVKDGKRWGNYTTRVILDSIPQEDAEAVRAMLSDTPTETTAR